MATITNFDLHQSLDLIWQTLDKYREKCIKSDDEWDDVCTAMAWIKESIQESEVE